MPRHFRRKGLDAADAARKADQLRTRPTLLKQLATLLALVSAALVLSGGVAAGVLLALGLFPLFMSQLNAGGDSLNRGGSSISYQ